WLRRRQLAVVPVKRPELLQRHQRSMSVKKRDVNRARQRLVRRPPVRNRGRTLPMSRESHHTHDASVKVSTVKSEHEALGRTIPSHWYDRPFDSVGDKRSFRRPYNLQLHPETRRTFKI